MKEEKLNNNGYTLSRKWFDYAFENPEKITPAHAALWFWLIEFNNRLAWKEKFGLPTDYSMQAIGIKNRRTYYKVLNDLITWGFIKMIQKSKNQHTASVIALSSACVKNAPAGIRQVSSTSHIDKHNKPIETLETPASENPPPKKPDFINCIIEEFIKTYPQYIITAATLGKERAWAKKLDTLWKELHPDYNTEQALQSMGEYFERCKTIQDPWYKANMSLTTMVTKYNTIQAMLTDDSGKQDLTNMEYEGGLK